MKIKVTRVQGTTGFTAGSMYIDDAFECFTLEDEVRDGEKVFGQTAIPAGNYKVIINFSQRFKRDLPLLLNVPNFEGIRIHSGNTAEDTHGCILVGKQRNGETVGASRLAFDPLYEKIVSARFKGEPVTIEIE